MLKADGKKAVVLGGSNGIGLAISKEFINRGYFVVILDSAVPDISMSVYDGQYEYYPCDLLDFDPEIFGKLAADDSVQALMITAGIGRVADFGELNIFEIERLFQINVVNEIKVVRLFYNCLKFKNPFFCGMMGSIAGWISSPMFSVYAASKAAICRFVESVNIELEISGIKNRILNVSPGSIQGTLFNGDSENQPDLTEGLAEEIVDKLFEHCELFIPDYEETYKDVITRYINDPHEFGISSYEYKLNSGRINREQNMKIGYLSGTFDLFHVGHLNILQRAKQNCDYLIVGVHPDASHKGKETFIPFEERMRIVGAIKYVDKVIPSCPEDSDVWDLYHYDILFVGSDYKGTDRFNRYEEYFKDKGVSILYFPYTEGTSSTQIRNTILLKTNDITGET